MIRVYVAGPYSDPDVMRVCDNIWCGINAAVTLLRNGFAPFCPWLDILMAIQAGPNALTVGELKAYSLAWLERADCLFVLPGWEHSEGTKAEINRAQELEIPVYYDMAEIARAYANH